MRVSLKFYITFFLVVIFLCSYLISYFFIAKKYETIVFDEMKVSAKILAQQILITRKWVALHSSVLVEKKDNLEPNPYLQEPYIVDNKGRIFIKMNPAFVTREISKIAEKEKYFFFRVTSTKAINPKNYPDSFEKEALLNFENSMKNEYYRLIDKSFRYLVPLITEESCISCHKGYKVGDIRGALSIFLPAEDLLRELAKTKKNFFLMLSLFYCSILAGFWIFIKFSIVNPIEHLINFAEGKEVALHRGVKSLEFDILSKKLKEAKEKDSKMKEKLEREIEKATSELSKINAKKIDFLIEIGHKLKTPLTVISSTVDYLMMKGSCTEDVKFVNILKKNVESLKRATDLILKAAQIDMGLMEGQFESLNLSELIYDLVQSLSNVKIHTQIEDNIYIKGDREKLLMALENVLHNAIKFNKENGKIYVSLKNSQGMAEITIKDEGIGIKLEDREKIFEKFYHKDIEGSERGTGLGLYITNKIVKTHRGEITFESEERVGTTFHIKIPIEVCNE